MQPKRHFFTKNTQSHQRIGPHNKDVLSVLTGHLLGDCHGEKRNQSSRFHLHMSSKNAEYIFWYHKFFADRGYCSPLKPVVKTQIGKGNRVYYSIKFRTFSFKSLNTLYDSFYDKERMRIKKKEKAQSYKIVPLDIETLLTPKALAVWIMDDGGKSGSGLKISTERYSLEENISLQKAIKKVCLFEPSIQRHKEQYVLYFNKDVLPSLFLFLKKDLLECMYYKFNVEK